MELSNEEFWRKVATSPVLPETAAPSPGAFEARFRAMGAAGADAVASGARGVTDSRGLPVTAGTLVHGGAIFRLVSARAGRTEDAE